MQRNSDDSDSLDAYLPGRNVNHDTTIDATRNTDVCQPCAFNVVPYEQHKKVRTVKTSIMRWGKKSGKVLYYVQSTVFIYALKYMEKGIPQSLH
jgi:hypothetical protein